MGCMGTSPTHPRRTDQGSRFSVNPRRLPASRKPGCLPPLQRGYVKGSLLFVSRAGLPLTPPTRYPHGWVQCALFSGHCEHHCRASPAMTSREQVTFSTRWPRSSRGVTRLSLTTQARQRGSVCLGLAGADCSHCSQADRSASTASTTEFEIAIRAGLSTCSGSRTSPLSELWPKPIRFRLLLIRRRFPAWILT
jgi:hypothetical protein